MEKRIIISVLAFYFMLNLQGSAQSEATIPLMIPTKTPNSLLYGIDVIIDNQPDQDQRDACLSIAFNGWLYAGYTVEEGSSHKWMIMRSTDNGETWSVLREQPLAPDWYNPDFDMVVCGINESELAVYVARVSQNDYLDASELLISKLDGNTGNTLTTLWDSYVTGDEKFNGVAIASDYRLPALNSIPYSVGVLYSKKILDHDSVNFLLSTNGGASITYYYLITKTYYYTRKVSLAYGRSQTMSDGHFFAAWEERNTPADDIGMIYTARSISYIYSPWTVPYRLDDLVVGSAGFSRNPSIACQFNNIDNVMGNLTEVVLFDRAFEGNIFDFDVMGLYNMEGVGYNPWQMFGLSYGSQTSDMQPDVIFDPEYNNFQATYFKKTDQKLPAVMKHMNMPDPYNWTVVSEQYNDGDNLTNPYPKVEINSVAKKTAYVWNAERTGGNGMAMFDAEYSVVGQQEISGKENIVTVFPNPANGKATFLAILDKPAKLTIHIYSLQGKELATIADGIFPSGRHRFLADLSGFTAGCYFYRGTIADRSETGRLMIVK